MIKIEAIVRTEKFEDVKEALSEIDIQGMTAYQVMGCGVQKGYTEVIRGHEVSINMLPKIKFEIVVADKKREDQIIEVIKKAAYTGNPGDGKIISYDLNKAVRIRTGELNEKAII